MSFSKDEFLKRRVDDFNKVDNFLRDLDCTDMKNVPRIEIRKVILYMYDLFEMPEDGFDEKKLQEIRKRFK